MTDTPTTTNYYANWTSNTNESSTMPNDIILEPDPNPPTILEVSVGVLLEQAAQGQANVIQYLAAYINALELRIAALEANQTSTDDEDKGPITRGVIFEMIGDRLDEFTRDYNFTSAVREIADEAVENINWSSVIDPEAIVREGLGDIL